MNIPDEIRICQSWIEVKYYSIVDFERITMFEVLCH